MARISSGLVFVGIKGRVLALDRRTGQQVWTARLTGSSFVNVARDGDLLLAVTGGEVFALHPKTGALQWHNPLKGLGLGVSSIVGEHNPASSVVAAAAASEQQRRQAAAGAA